jgi:hypothetical protein
MLSMKANDARTEDPMSSMSKSAKHAAANHALAVAMVGKRTSSAAGKHADRRTKRNRTRAAQRANAVKGW